MRVCEQFNCATRDGGPADKFFGAVFLVVSGVQFFMLDGTGAFISLFIAFMYLRLIRLARKIEAKQ